MSRVSIFCHVLRFEIVANVVSTARSWSYDNLVTYPVMPPITKKEKRIQRQVVDGEEQDVEVEVEITQPMKRLFLFSGKEASL